MYRLRNVSRPKVTERVGESENGDDYNEKEDGNIENCGNVSRSLKKSEKLFYVQT